MLIPGEIQRDFPEVLILEGFRARNDANREICVPRDAAGNGISRFMHDDSTNNTCMSTLIDGVFEHIRHAGHRIRASGDRIGGMLAASVNDASSPWEFYNHRARELNAQSDEVARLRGNYLAGLISLGVLGCILLYQAFVVKRVPGWTPFAVIPFGVYVGWEMTRCKRKALKLFRLAEYYDTGIARLDHKWEDLEEGREFADSDQIGRAHV